MTMAHRATRRTALSTTDSPALVLGDRDLAAPLHAAGAPVTLVSRPTDIARYSRYVSRWLADPRPDDDALAATLLAAARLGRQPAVLFYQQDDDLLFVSRRRRELAPDLRFVIASADLVEKLVDKAAFQDLAAQVGLPVPCGRVLDLTGPLPATAELSFPLLVKPLRRESSWDSASAAKAAVVRDGRQLDDLVRRLDGRHARVIVQQPIDGPESRIESYHVYVDATGQVAAEFTGRKLRTYPRSLGHSTAVVTTDAPDVVRVGRDVVDRLALTGVAKLDFKRGADGRLWLLEINPRFNLWHNVGAAAGVNIPATVRADLLGRPRPRRAAARPGVAWCHVKPDLLSAREEGTSVGSWLRWAVACETRSGLDPADPMPHLVGKLAVPLYRRIRRRPERPDGT
ncbi:ATP-grasp domain-containing protein [Geodermatophilus sp. DF01-2]|nr:ATP-grasp domain-containing protein [Geodermatophilus sp. DF01_2]